MKPRPPCKRCGGPVTIYGRSYCSPECHSLRFGRLCRCGKACLPKRRTCSDECVLTSQRGGRPGKTPRPCKACGKDTEKQAVFCAPCRPLAPPRMCAYCLTQPVPKGRRTCSEECKRAWHIKVCPRSGKKDKSGYKGKDKQAIIARLYEEQGGRCKACGDEGEVKTKENQAGLLVLDHDHLTGAARCLLCVRCNAALGLVKESPARIQGLLRYIVDLCA